MTPATLFDALVQFGPDLWKATTDTFLMVGVTLIAAVVLGTPLGVLLAHIAEHTQRHTGQLIVLCKFAYSSDR